MKVALAIVGIVLLVMGASAGGVAIGLNQRPAASDANRLRCEDALLRRRNADQAAASIKAPQTGNPGLDAALVNNATKEAERQAREATNDIARLC